MLPAPLDTSQTFGLSGPAREIRDILLDIVWKGEPSDAVWHRRLHTRCVSVHRGHPAALCPSQHPQGLQPVSGSGGPQETSVGGKRRYGNATSPDRKTILIHMTMEIGTAVTATNNHSLTDDTETRPNRGDNWPSLGTQLPTTW